MKRMILTILLCSAVLALSACNAEKGSGKTDTGKNTGSKDIELKIAFWGAAGEEDALKEAAEGITGEVAGVSAVKWQQFPSVEEFYGTLPTESVIGRIPDIVVLNNEEQKSLIKAGLLEPLNEIPNASDYIGNVMEEWQYDGKLYGLPATAAPALFIVNDAMLSDSGLTEYPKTWAQVYESAKVLKAHGYTPVCIDIGNMYHVTQYLLSFGGGWNEGTEINTAENQEALSYILKMFDEGLAVTAQDMGKSWDGEVFAAGECAMSTGGTWYIGTLKDVPGIQYTVLPVPHTEEGNHKTLHSYGYAVMSGSQNKEVAQEAIKYLIREDAQAIRMRITGDCPSLLSMQDAYYKLYPKLTFMRTDISTAQPFQYPVNAALLDMVQDKLKQRIYGEQPNLTPAEILSP